MAEWKNLSKVEDNYMLKTNTIRNNEFPMPVHSDFILYSCCCCCKAIDVILPLSSEVKFKIKMNQQK
jgi:hypothetical protein